MTGRRHEGRGENQSLGHLNRKRNVWDKLGLRIPKGGGLSGKRVEIWLRERGLSRPGVKNNKPLSRNATLAEQIVRASWLRVLQGGGKISSMAYSLHTKLYKGKKKGGNPKKSSLAVASTAR